MQALLLYEEGIPDTAAQRVALAAMTGALQRAKLPAEARAALVAKTTGYAARLLRRADQCRAVLACSHMHWQVRLCVPQLPWHLHIQLTTAPIQVAPAAQEDTVRPDTQPAERPEDGSNEPPTAQAASSEQPEAVAGLVQDAEEVMKCLKRAIKWAHAAQQQVKARMLLVETLP